MSLQDITNKIISDAKKEAEEIITQNKKEMEKFTAQKNGEIEKAINSIKVIGEKKSAKLKEQAAFQVRMIKKNAMLKTRQDLINQVLVELKSKLANLNNADFKKLIINAFNNTPLIKDAEIITSVEKRDLITKAVKELKLPYQMSEEHLLKGQEGFIVSSELIEVNNIIDSIVNSKKEKLEEEIVEILFA